MVDIVGWNLQRVRRPAAFAKIAAHDRCTMLRAKVFEHSTDIHAAGFRERRWIETRENEVRDVLDLFLTEPGDAELVPPAQMLSDGCDEFKPAEKSLRNHSHPGGAVTFRL